MVFVMKEWMRLCGGNYFETDENFMRFESFLFNKENEKNTKNK